MFNFRWKLSHFYNGMCFNYILHNFYHYKTKLFEEYFLINICRLLTTILLTVLMLFSGGSSGPEKKQQKGVNELLKHFEMSHDNRSTHCLVWPRSDYLAQRLTSLRWPGPGFTLAISSSRATQNAMPSWRYFAQGFTRVCFMTVPNTNRNCGNT